MVRAEGDSFALCSDAFSLTHYSGYNLKRHARQSSDSCIANLEFVVRTFMSFLGMLCAGTNPSDFGERRVLTVKRGVKGSLSLHQRGRIVQSNVFELQWDRGYDINLSFFTFSRSLEVDWSRCESSWYHATLMPH